MPTTLQIRRGNTPTAASTTTAVGELFVNTDTNQLSVGNGVAAGGVLVARNSDLISASLYANTGIANAASASLYANTGITLAQASFNAANNAGGGAPTGAILYGEPGALPYPQYLPANGATYLKSEYPTLGSLCGAPIDLVGFNNVSVVNMGTAGEIAIRPEYSATNGTRTVIFGRRAEDAGIPFPCIWSTTDNVTYTETIFDTWTGDAAAKLAWFTDWPVLNADGVPGFLEYINNKFFACYHNSQLGRSVLMQSIDGITWTDISPTVLVSGGINWTYQYLSSIAWDGTTYVMIRNNDGTGPVGCENILYTTTPSDNTSWLVRDLGSVGNGSIVYGNGVWVIYSETSSFYTWTNITTDPVPVADNYFSMQGYKKSENGYFPPNYFIKFNNGKFFLVDQKVNYFSGNNINYGPLLYTSTNGLNWIYPHITTNAGFTAEYVQQWLQCDMVFNGDLVFVTFCSAATKYAIFSSDNGSTWKQLPDATNTGIAGTPGMENYATLSAGLIDDPAKNHVGNPDFELGMTWHTTNQTPGYVSQYGANITTAVNTTTGGFTMYSYQEKMLMNSGTMVWALVATNYLGRSYDPAVSFPVPTLNGITPVGLGVNTLLPFIKS